MVAMRHSKGRIKCVPALTQEEKQLKTILYKEAKVLGLQVVDRADIVQVEK